MNKQRKKTITSLSVVLTVCGAVLLVFILGMLIMRCRSVESELDRMLIESLTAHTAEAGANAGELLHDVSAVLDAGEQLLSMSGRPAEKNVAERLLETVNLASHRFTLNYLDSQDLTGAKPGTEEYELFQTVLSGEEAFSGFLSDAGQSDAYLLVIRPMLEGGRVVGALQAKLNADLLSQPEQHSTFFQNVHCVVAGADGRIVYSSNAGSQGLSLVSVEEENGITEREAQDFSATYQANPVGAFFYDPPEGRCYVAWAEISFNGWRVVQFSQSANVQIERSSILQTGMLLISLAVCVVLAALSWRQRGKLAEEKLRYNALAEFKDTLLFEYDCKDDSMEFTSNAMETLDLENARLEHVVSGGDSFPIFHPDDIESVRRVLRGAADMAPDQIEHDRTRIKKRDGEYSWYRSQYKAVFNPDGQVVRVIGTLTDISAQIDRETELRQQAQQDPLTGLYNRAGVKLINARLEQISRGVLFMLDLDDFKSINDNYGHAAGDKLLVAVARILEETFRTDDIVARVGGDEFVALLSGSDNEEMARQKAQELLDRVHALRIEGINTVASVSVGAASAPACGRTYETLSAAADEALYSIKKGGKGGFALR